MESELQVTRWVCWGANDAAYGPVCVTAADKSQKAVLISWAAFVKMKF